MKTFFFETTHASVAAALIMVSGSGVRSQHAIVAAPGPTSKEERLFIPRKKPDWEKPSRQEHRNQQRRDSQRIKAKSFRPYS